MSWLLADFEAREIMWLLVAAMSVLGGIFGKKKQDAAKSAAKPSKPRVAPKPPSFKAPTPPRLGKAMRGPAHAPPPLRPATRAAAPRRESILPVRGAPQRMPEMPPRMQPPPRRTRVVPEPAAMRTRVAPRGGSPATPEQRRSPEKPRRRAAPQEVESGRRLVADSAPIASPHRKPMTRTNKIIRVLSSQSGLRSAIILTEILAPPVALRDNHLN